MTPETADMSSVTRRNDFIMQNHFEKNRESLPFNKHNNYTQKCVTFLPNILKSYIIISDIMFFAEENKINSIPLS